MGATFIRASWHTFNTQWSCSTTSHSNECCYDSSLMVLYKCRSLLVDVKASLEMDLPHMLLWDQRPNSPHPTSGLHTSGAFSGLRPICSPLPLPFSSDPQSLPFCFRQSKKYPKSPSCDRASDSVAPKTLSCTGTDHQEWLSPQHECSSQRTHHRFHHHAPSTATASSLLGTTPHYYPLQSPYVESAQAIHCRPVHCASSRISTLCLRCSRSNDYQPHISTTSIFSTDTSYSRGARSIGTSTFKTVASPHQSDCLVLPHSYSPASTLDYPSTSSANFHGTDGDCERFFYDHTPPSEKPTQSIGLNALNDQSNWSATLTSSQVHGTSRGQASPLVAFEPCIGERRQNVAVSSSEPDIPCESMVSIPTSSRR